MVNHGVGLTSRILPPEEWPRLLETGACAFKITGTPIRRGEMIVEELDRLIVGCALVFQTPDGDTHIDGVWVHPSFRTGRVALRLWRGIRRLMRDFGVSRASVYPTSTRLHTWAIGMPFLRVKGLFTLEAAHAR